MEHIDFWPIALNFPFVEKVVGPAADADFWREIHTCYLCKSEFDRRYKKDYPEIATGKFWEEVEFFLEDDHVLIDLIAEYFKAEVLLISGGCSKKEEQKFAKDLLHVYCHFLVCRKCTTVYDNVVERVIQENSRVEEVFKYYEA